MLDWGVGVELWHISGPQLFFFWVNNRRACAWVLLKDMSVSTLGQPLLWNFLSKARLVFNLSPSFFGQTKDWTFLGLWLPLGCCLLQHWWCAWQKRWGGLGHGGYHLWSCPCTTLQIAPSQPFRTPNDWDHHPGSCLQKQEAWKWISDSDNYHVCQEGPPCTLQSEARCTDGEVNGWCWVLWMLSLLFQVNRGAMDSKTDR